MDYSSNHMRVEIFEIGQTSSDSQIPITTVLQGLIVILGKLSVPSSQRVICFMGHISIPMLEEIYEIGQSSWEKRW